MTTAAHAAGLVGGLLLGASAARAGIIDVPGDFATIQAAIDAAGIGDEIVVADGVYSGAGNVNLDYGGLAITLRSANGPAACIIDCLGAATTRGLDFHSAENASAVLQGFTIRNGNMTGPFPNTRGGAIRCEGATPTIIDCVFTDNTAGDGGAVANLNGARPTFVRCLFLDNQATSNGGAMNNNTNCRPTLVSCVLRGNTAAQGAGLYNFVVSKPTLINCAVDGNTAAVVGGGMANIAQSDPNLFDCTIAGNAAGLGGGLYNIDDAIPIVANTIIWGNTPEAIYTEISDPAVITYSLVEGGWAGTGNVDADPKLADLAAGDLRLRAGSPAIDAGDNTAVPKDDQDLDDDGDTLEATPLDLADRARHVDDPATADTGNPDGLHAPVDMGAHEFQCPADTNGDGTVDGVDVVTVILAWGLPGTAADVDGNGVVEGADLVAVILAWGPC